jgi:hypothetical protein
VNRKLSHGQNQDPIPERDKFVTPEDTPNFNIDAEGEITRSARFTCNGHTVEILVPDKEHFIGNYWQIRIDGVIRGNYVFNSARMAADEAMKLIDTGSFP